MDPIQRDLETVAEYGGGTDAVWHVPEHAAVRLADGPGHLDREAVDSGLATPSRRHLLEGATITSWSDPRVLNAADAYVNSR